MLKIRCWQLWKSCQIVPLQLFWFNVTASEHYHSTLGEQILTDKLHCTPEAVTPTWPGKQFLLQDQSHFVTCQRSTRAQWTGLPTWGTAGYCWQNPPSVLAVKDKLWNTTYKNNAIFVILLLFWHNRRKTPLRKVQCYLYQLSHSYQMWGNKAYCNCQYFRKRKTYDTSSNFTLFALYSLFTYQTIKHFIQTHNAHITSHPHLPLYYTQYEILNLALNFFNWQEFTQKRYLSLLIAILFKLHDALHSDQC